MSALRRSLTVLLGVFASLAATSEHSGRCPALDEWGICPIPTNKCTTDESCAANEKCCASACGPACVKPLYTGCEQVAMEAERRARAMGPAGSQVRIPRCTSSGDFDSVQCDTKRPLCWCVDETGFEVPGTRAPARGLVNCTNPKPCAGHTCRMLCPHGFALEDDGCPRCQCRDPCAEVQCPGSLSCELEDVACVKQPCPPIPRCKRARSLENVCPAGDPLRITDSRRPFLCGTTPGKPTCPPLFQCIVQTGNDYGVCCPASFKLQKPGMCPASEDRDACGMRCEHDLECPSMEKCCASDACGRHCSQPQNVTVCLQQKMLAELLVMNEREGKGYVPQCSPITSLFEPKQCSRNGLVCWCVDPNGNKLPGTMGPGENVTCHSVTHVRPSGRSFSSSNCDRNMCAQVCEYGFKVDIEGCPTCECDDPCEAFQCGEQEECVTVKEEGCTDFLCQTSPVCRRKDVYVNPCEMGAPLSDPLTGEVMTCEEGINGESAGCPGGHTCTYVSATGQTVCCPSKESVEVTKWGMCPFVMLDSCNKTVACQSDSDCEGDDKCCYSSNCKAVCVAPLQPPQERELRPPTMCEYLRDFSEKMEGTREGMGLALPQPRCYQNGSYEETQCIDIDGQKQCWCVDSFGTEIPRTRTNESTPNCAALREELSCLDLTCRLGCDYGFVLHPETRCPLCECRNPCDTVNCGAGEACQMIEVNCEDEYCPAVPACLPSKLGQCPYLVPVSSGSCDYECKTDIQCNGTAKCCSNGCGTQCVEPVVMTACQHQRTIVQHKASEQGIPARQLYIPQCKASDGSFEPVQCHPTTRQCWCVDQAGQEIAGTRAPPDVQPSCQAPSECPLLKCAQNCEHGYRLNAAGCRTCKCRDPCEEVSCRGEGEMCRLVQVACMDRPCPPIPMCLPRRENPCQAGHPLLRRGSEEVVMCGPNGSLCPSSHKCHLSPLGEYAVCCPKPRDICFEPQDAGPCRSAKSRWFFNSELNKCEEFVYGGCGGNQNNFESENICNTVCPVLSQCERLREKNQRAAEKYKKATFTPRCDPESGHWEPVQCLEHVGVCWCVNRKGEPLKGSLTRGTSPVCNSRQARRRMDPEPDRAIEELLKRVTVLEDESENTSTGDVGLGTDTMPLTTRCQALQEKMKGTSALYAVDCDAEGRFAPTQCYPRNSEKFPECWCVDEAGNQLPNTTTFKRGTKICLPTPIEAVEIKLGFHGQYNQTVEKQIEDQIRTVLTRLGAKVKDEKLEVEAYPDATYIHFAVIGNNKVNVAFLLEELVKSQKISVLVDARTDVPLIADITKSRFRHHLPDYLSNEVSLSERVIALEHREIVSQSTVSEVTSYQTAIIVLCAGSAFIICVLILVIVLYRKKMSEADGNKTAALGQRFVPGSSPIYVVSLPGKRDEMQETQGFPRVGISAGEPEYDTMARPGRRGTAAQRRDPAEDAEPKTDL